jgi:chromosomal replication initiation ATPase DnaA
MAVSTLPNQSTQSPMPETRQLPLDLALEPRFGEEDFLVSGSNAEAYALIEAWPAWPSGMLTLIGPPASGKSHLAAIWAARASARMLPSRALDKTDLPALVAAGAVVIEDCGAGAIHETRLFHLLNLAQEKQASLLLTSSSHPSEWRVTTPDLASRLRKMPVATIAEPDDALIRTLLVKLFIDRQLVVDTTLVEYLLPRIERSFAGVAATVDLLDRETLARGKRLTRAMAASILNITAS